jgi:type I restriction enzyme S subunit
MLFPLPPLSEQKRIVGILNEAFQAIDRAKENAEKNLANAREVFDSYLNQVFSNPGKDWEEKKLGKVCIDISYGTSAKSERKGLVPVLRMGNLQNGSIDWSDLVYTSKEDEISKYALEMNDILFNRTNSPELVGKTVIYKGERPSIFAGYIIRIRVNEAVVLPDYLNIWLNRKAIREYGFSVMVSSVNQANINGSKLKEYPLTVPPLADQTCLVNNLNVLSIETKRLESIYQQKLAALDELKKSILQKAFSGEL